MPTRQMALTESSWTSRTVCAARPRRELDQVVGADAAERHLEKLQPERGAYAVATSARSNNDRRRPSGKAR